MNKLYISIGILVFFVVLAISVYLSNSGNQDSLNPYVNYDDFLDLATEVQPYREERLVDLDTFLDMSEDEDVIILDARSNEMYEGKHIKGALNLTFADFTQRRLAEIIPSKDTKILIYCNNNFVGDELFFETKAIQDVSENLSLALNIPTYINLYGYGYKNVYELSELVPIFDERIEFEGTSV